MLPNIDNLASEEHFWGKIVKGELGFEICLLKNSRQSLFVLHLLSLKYFKKLIDGSNRLEVSYKIGVFKNILQN